MNETYCKDCRYFIQHYALDNKKLFQVHFGHCTYSNAKAKRPDAKVCKNFIEGTSREDAFVSKEYLSKALLEYMTGLDLLPEIKNRR